MLTRGTAPGRTRQRRDLLPDHRFLVVLATASSLTGLLTSGGLAAPRATARGAYKKSGNAVATQPVTTVHRQPTGYLVICKGAPEFLLHGDAVSAEDA